jgi:RNA polymerase sigma-70 factor, ECF subfamily
MKPVDADDLRSIVRRVRQGDREAFGKIVALFQNRLMSLATMVIRDPAAAEEIVQDTFVRAYVHFERYDDKRALYPWLATIAVRLSQNWSVRKQRSRIDDSADPERHATGANPEQELSLDQGKMRLWSAVEALPKGERLAVLLCYRQEMSVAEAARALDVTAGTVKTWLFRARRKLRKELAHPEVSDLSQVEELI